MTNDLDIPIFKKTYNLYKICYQHRNTIAKQDRHVLWQKVEQTILETLEEILFAIQTSKVEKIPMLERASVKINLLRVLVRLAHDIKVIDDKKYLAIEASIDEIGRMLGGWLRSTKG